MLVGYFDESERLIAGDPLSVAGFVFTPTKYKQFCRRWRQMLADAPGGRVEYFHMKELWAGTEEFEGRTHEQRLPVLKSAVNIVNESALAGIGVAVRQKEFELVASQDFPQVYGSIYTVLCQQSVAFTAMWLDDNRRRAPVHYFFESGHKYAHEAGAWLDAWHADAAVTEDLCYHGHGFLPKKSACGLQAADMLAWLVTRVYASEKPSKAKQPFADALIQLTEARPQRRRITLLDKEDLQRLMAGWQVRRFTPLEPGDKAIDPGPRVRRLR